MACIDWNKVALDYQNSTFFEERIRNYARKTAETLLKSNIAFNGYTDDGCIKTVARKYIAGVINRLFPANPPKVPARLDSLHMGYWELETCVEERHFGYRYKEPYIDKRSYSYMMKYKKTPVFCGQAAIFDSKWVLLENGMLAAHLAKTRYKECPCEYVQGYWNMVRECGVSAFSSLEIHDKRTESEWRVMTANDIMLLDHKKREAKQRFIKRDDYYVCDGYYLSADNDLLTGKKGNGCIKKMTALLKKYNL